ncbi:MAG: hypothetical protein FJX02_05865 [Alphaproteobacteria bacterium]|nr:hypothetical protein [Alphaproteobacteria bacterium]
MTNLAEQELIDVGDMDVVAFNDFAAEQGWSDGLPLYLPTEQAVLRMVETVRGDNRPFAPISPRQVLPTLHGLAANAVMAGCRPEYFPAVTAALRAVLDPDYNLHGTLATTHPCAPMLMVNGPARKNLGINCGSNCFGQGWRANAAIGRALALILLNVGGAKPGEMDRATQGSPAKYSYCFGENEEESPWEPYHVRRGFAASDSVVTAMSAEPPHNINDHGSTSGEGLLTTISNTVGQPGANTIYGRGPLFVVLGPEHAQTLHRDGFTIETMQEEIWRRSRVHVSKVSKENQESYAGFNRPREGDWYPLTPSPADIHIAVAGGAGKHSAFIASFGGTKASAVRIAP